MDAAILLAIVVVLSLGATLALLVQRWGAGNARRRVRCPENRKRATIVVEEREGSFGSLVVSDVLSCSLLPPGRRVACGKDCVMGGRQQAA